MCLCCYINMYAYRFVARCQRDGNSNGPWGTQLCGVLVVRLKLIIMNALRHWKIIMIPFCCFCYIFCFYVFLGHVCECGGVQQNNTQSQREKCVQLEKCFVLALLSAACLLTSSALKSFVRRSYFRALSNFLVH